MTERSSLFRREALDFQAGLLGDGSVLRIDPPWSRWSYWVVLAVLVAGVLVVSIVRTSETTSGPALIDVRERAFVALVPNAASADLRRGQQVRLQVHGAARAALPARVLTSEVADEASVRRAGFASSSQPAMLVTGVLDRHADVASLPSSPRPAGRAVVVLRSQTIVSLFRSQLRGSVGDGDS